MSGDSPLLGFAPGDLLDGGPLRVVREIGRGGMAAVYLVEDAESRERFAAKVPLEHVGQDELSLQRFTREAEIWIRLGAHPGIVRAFSILIVAGRPCIVVELIEGGSVRALMARHDGHSPLPEALEIARQVAAALAFVHGQGVLHRDLKPDNLLLTGSGVVKVTDFGIVQGERPAEEQVRAELSRESLSFDEALCRTLTQVGATGTPAYMAPQQFDGHSSRSTDVYAFGVTLYELLAGRRPIDHRDQSFSATFGLPFALHVVYAHLHRTVEPVDLRKHRADVPDALAELVSECLGKESRVSDFKELETRLAAIQATLQFPRTALASPGAPSADPQQVARKTGQYLLGLAEVEMTNGGLDAALRLAEDAETAFRNTGDHLGVARALLRQVRARALLFSDPAEIDILLHTIRLMDRSHGLGLRNSLLRAIHAWASVLPSPPQLEPVLGLSTGTPLEMGNDDTGAGDEDGGGGTNFLDVRSDDHVLQILWLDRCYCGGLWSMISYTRNPGGDERRDLVTCRCLGCARTAIHAFRAEVIHERVTDLLQANRGWVRLG